jgi:hypothetical protein
VEECVDRLAGGLEAATTALRAIHRRTVPKTGSCELAAGAENAALSREPSPAEVAKEGQGDDDDDQNPKPGRHVILSSGAVRVYGWTTRICNATRCSVAGVTLLLSRARTTDARDARRAGAIALIPADLSRHCVKQPVANVGGVENRGLRPPGDSPWVRSRPVGGPKSAGPPDPALFVLPQLARCSP